MNRLCLLSEALGRGRNLKTSSTLSSQTRAFRRKKTAVQSVDPRELEKQGASDNQDFIIAILGTLQKQVDPKWTREEIVKRKETRLNFEKGLQKFHNNLKQDLNVKIKLQWAAINSLPTFLREETLVQPDSVKLFDPRHTLLDYSYYPKPGRFFEYKPNLVKKKKREEFIQPMMQEVVLDDDDDF